MNKKEITDDIKKYKSIEAVANSGGGKIILNDVKSDVVSVIDQLSTKYKELTHIEFIAFCAELSEKLTMMRVLTRAKDNKAMAIEALEESGYENDKEEE